MAEPTPTATVSIGFSPALSGDLFGDWREEVIWRAEDNSSLRIYTTTIPALNRLETLMHDRTYRLSIAWQNVGYNQPRIPVSFSVTACGGLRVRAFRSLPASRSRCSSARAQYGHVQFAISARSVPCSCA